MQTIDLLTANQLADKLQISLRTLYRMIKANQIPRKRVGGQWRFDWSEVLKSINSDTGSRIPRTRKTSEGSQAGA